MAAGAIVVTAGAAVRNMADTAADDLHRGLMRVFNRGTYLNRVFSKMGVFPNLKFLQMLKLKRPISQLASGKV